MEYANAGRVIREVGGAAKDAFVVYVEPKIAEAAGIAKEILLFPYKKMAGPIFNYIKSKIEGKQPDLVVDGKSINFILPEKYTKLGYSKDLHLIWGGEDLENVNWGGDYFNDVVRDHQDLLDYYQKMPNRKLYVDTDMNIYELENGGNTLLKIFGEGRFYDNSEFKEIPISEALDKGLQTVKDFLERRRELVDRERSDFIPLSNIFPSSSQQEAKDQLNDYLFDTRLHPLLNEDTKKVHKVEKLDANSFSNLLKRLKQERNWEKETNMRDRLETDEIFLRVLSKKELAEKAKQLFEIYMKKGTLSLENVKHIFMKKEKSTYYNSSNPYRNVFLDQINNDIKLIEGQAPSIKGIIGDRAKNLAIDAGIGVVGSTMDKLLPPLISGVALFASFLIGKAFKMRRANSRIEYPEKLEKFLDTSTHLIQTMQAQFAGQIIAQQNSNNFMQVITESVNEALKEINRLNKEKNTKQLENVFNKIIKDNPDDKVIFEDQDVPYTVELIEVEVPRQKKLIMPKRRKTIDYDKLEKELYDQYVVKRADPFPLKAWLGKLRVNKQFGPKYNVLKKIVGLIGSLPSAPEIPLPKTQFAPLYPALPAPEVPFVDDVLALPAPREVLALPAPPPHDNINVVDEQLLFQKLYDRYILGGGSLFSLKAEIGEKARKKQYDSEYNVYKTIYNLAIDKYRKIEDKKPLPFIEPEFLKNYAYQGDNEKIDWQNLKVEDVYESPNKKIKTDWPNGTFPSTSEKIKDTAEKIWGKCFFIFLIF